MFQALLADHYSFWLPEQASSVAQSHDALFNFIMAINIFFSSLIMALLLLFVFKFRHREGSKKKHDPTGGHSTALELTWTIIPTLLVLVIFWFGFRGYLHANVMPPNATEVIVDGKMWNWSFTYPNGATDSDLHVVVNQPVKFVLQSADVIHDFDVPSFRMKKDVVPGRFNRMWFEPTKEGVYNIYCAMYCGQGHSVMLAKCVVEDENSFKRYMDKISDPLSTKSFIDHGQELYIKRGCVQCHSVDGSRLTGPSWKDLYGSMVACEGGGEYMADDAYIAESIVAPSAKIVKGFENKMPAGYGDSLKKEDIISLTWYMKSISSNFKGDLAPGKAIRGPKTGTTVLPGSPAVAPTSQPVAAPATPPK